MIDDVRKGSTTDYVLEVWKRRKWLAVLVFGVVAAAAAGIVTRLPDMYRSSATILVERRQVAEMLMQQPTAPGEVETRLETISQEILSRPRLEKLIARFGLYPERTRESSVSSAATRMRKDIQLEFKSAENANRIITIAFTVSYRGRDPETVARVTNALATSYIEENTKFREHQASGVVSFLKAELETVRQRVDEQEMRVKEFRARHVSELPQQMALNLATLERLNAQLHLSSANQLRAMDRRAQAVKDLAEADPSASAGSPDAVNGKLMKLKQELLDVRHFSDKYPDVIRLKGEIALLERDLAAATPPVAATAPPPSTNPAVVRYRAAVASADAEIAALKAEEERLRRDIAGYQRRAESAPQREMEMQELSRDAERMKEHYATLQKRYEDAKLAESMEQRRQGEEFRLLDPATASTEPSAPSRSKLLVVGVILSLAVAAAAVVLAEHLDTSFHTVGGLRTRVKVPILATIPPIVTIGDRRRRRWRFWPLSMSVAVGLLVILRAAQYIATGNERLVSLLAPGTFR